MTPEEIQEYFPPFYRSFEFWLNFVIGGAGLWFSYFAFREAEKAKEAAEDAARRVRFQTATVELAEIHHRLDRMDTEINFAMARDLLNEVTRRIMRLIAPIENEPSFLGTCDDLKKLLSRTKATLARVQPVDLDTSPTSVYVGIQGEFAEINAQVAKIMGLFETLTIHPKK